MRFVAVFSFLMLALAGCPKGEAQPRKPGRPQVAPAPDPNKGPTDADHRKADALALAVEIDNALGTYQRLERMTETPPRKLELFKNGKLPVKLKVDDVAPDGKVAHSTEFYFKGGHLAYVRHEQGLFLFEGDSMLLWLDRVTQQVKRGVSPQDAMKVADDLRITARKEVDAFQ